MRVQTERSSGPAPVVVLQLQINRGLGVRRWPYLGFVAISRQSFLSRNPLAVLPPNGGGNLAPRGRKLDGMQDFRLPVAHRVGIKRGRRVLAPSPSTTEKVIVAPVRLTNTASATY